MKLSSQFRRVALVLSIIYLVSFLVQVIIRIQHYDLHALLYPLFFITEFGYLTAILYCIALVKALGESKVALVAFYIFLVMHIVNFLFEMLESFSHIDPQLSLIFGAMLTLCSIFLIVACFMVKDPGYEKYFKVYGCSLIMMLIYNIGTPIIFPFLFHSDLIYVIYRYLYLVALLPFFAMTYIIYVSGKIFKPLDIDSLEEPLST
jgi:hypothetical protein